MRKSGQNLPSTALNSCQAQASRVCDILWHICVVSEGGRRVCLASFPHHHIFICQKFPLSGLQAVVRVKKASSIGSLSLLRQKLNLESSFFFGYGAPEDLRQLCSNLIHIPVGGKLKRPCPKKLQGRCNACPSHRSRLECGGDLLQPIFCPCNGQYAMLR